LDPGLGRNLEFLLEKYNNDCVSLIKDIYSQLKEKANADKNSDHPKFSITIDLRRKFKCQTFNILKPLLKRINSVLESLSLKVSTNDYAENIPDFKGHDHEIIYPVHLKPNERSNFEQVREWTVVYEYDNPYLFVVSQIPKLIPQEETELGTLLWKDLSKSEEEASADITFEMGIKRLRAHSTVVSVRSEALKKLCSTTMRENTSAVKKIEEDKPETFEEFLYLMYHGKLKCDPKDPIKRTLTDLIELMKLLDKYDTKSLIKIVLNEILITYQTLTISNVNFERVFKDILTLFNYVHDESDQKNVYSLLDKIFIFANADQKNCEIIVNEITDKTICVNFLEVAKQHACQNIVETIQSKLIELAF
jgi:hypothetical protein